MMVASGEGRPSARAADESDGCGGRGRQECSRKGDLGHHPDHPDSDDKVCKLVDGIAISEILH